MSFLFPLKLTNNRQKQPKIANNRAKKGKKFLKKSNVALQVSYFFYRFYNRGAMFLINQFLIKKIVYLRVIQAKLLRRLRSELFDSQKKTVYRFLGMNFQLSRIQEVFSLPNSRKMKCDSHPIVNLLPIFIHPQLSFIRNLKHIESQKHCLGKLG